MSIEYIFLKIVFSENEMKIMHFLKVQRQVRSFKNIYTFLSHSVTLSLHKFSHYILKEPFISNRCTICHVKNLLYNKLLNGTEKTCEISKHYKNNNINAKYINIIKIINPPKIVHNCHNYGGVLIKITSSLILLQFEFI